LRRGWTYITPSYRLLPESTGEDVIADAIDAAAWVASNLTKRLVVAGSSAGGFLSLSVATRMTAPRPLAMLSIYGMLDMTSSRYVEPGTTLMENPLIHNAGSLLQEMDAMKGTSALDGYPFPQNPLTDKRMSWIAAAHQEATYPDLITGYPGLAAMIRKNGVDSIPLKYRQLFPVAFGLRADLPPVALLHGDQDTAVGYEQSIQCAKALAGFGVSVACEIVPGKGHGFDVMEISPDVDIEHQTADGDLVYQQLRNILNFIDSTTN
jgi:acetyl esterase/lipase